MCGAVALSAIANAAEQSGGAHATIAGPEEALRLEAGPRPAWGLVHAFITAEGAFSRGEDALALRDSYTRMVRDALSADHLEQTSAIVVFALWRLLMLTKEPSADEAAFLFHAADRYLEKGSAARRILQEDISLVGTSLAGFEADIWSVLAGIASGNGDFARSVVYMSAARAASTSWSFGFEDEVKQRMRDGLSKETEEEIEAYLAHYGFSTGIVVGSADRFAQALWDGTRLARERRFREAAPPLWDAMESADVNVRVSAGRRLLSVLRRTGVPARDLLELANILVDDARQSLERLNFGFLQVVLIERALIKDRKSDGFDGAVEDLIVAANLTPAAAPSANALRYLARLHEFAGRVQEARRYYRALVDFRDISGGNEWLETGHYYLAQLERNAGQLNESIALLQNLEAMTRNRTDSAFYGACRFWLARLYRHQGRFDEALSTFEELMETRPFGFYGLRARMHVNGGEGASDRVFLDDESAAFVAAAYRERSEAVSQPQGEDLNLLRVLWALDEGLYSDTFELTEHLFESDERRYYAGNPSYLSRTGELSALAVWRSLRQDLWSSETLKRFPSARVDIATRLGMVGDWLTAHQVLHRWGTDFSPGSGYLRASYPAAFRDLILEASVDGSVPPELLYGAAYAESRFSSRAISKVGALGLFQFMPGTVESLGVNDSYPHWRNDLQGSLADQIFAVNLASQWLSGILASHGGDLILAVMAHNAGSDAVSDWFDLGGHVQGRSSCRMDVEGCIERARSVETRGFAREVWVAMVISRAVGMFRESVPF